jgi:hypothetical protein
VLIPAEAAASARGWFVSRKAEDSGNGAKHPDTVNQAKLKDSSGSVAAGQ